MEFQTEAWERYSDSQNRAKRIVRRGADITLPVLESILDKTKVAGEVDLGVIEIPVNQIVGIASDCDKEIYTSDFLPLSSIMSEYAESWTWLYMEHMGDAGLHEAIRCYEYLGKFYVIDGKKRVSILKSNGTAVAKAAVIRILPVKSEAPDIQSYYDFLETYEKTGLYQIALTQPGTADAFLEALGYNPEHVWNEVERCSFMFYWYPFEHALKMAFDRNLNITTADAVSLLLKKHSYAELRKLPSWTLAEMMQDSWVEMCQICNPEFQINARVA